MSKLRKFSLIAMLCLSQTACLGTIVGTTADVAIEVAKVPFKVGGAVVDVIKGDGNKSKPSNDGED